MLTWLDFLAHQALNSMTERDHVTDPRTALALTIGRLSKGVQDGRFRFPNGILDEIFYTLLVPFVAPYAPAGATMTFSDGQAFERPLGLILSRQTAGILASAKPLDIADDLWRGPLGPRRHVYVDIPPGAMTLRLDPSTTDVLHVRAILAAPHLPLSMPGRTQLLIQVTAPRSERGLGRIAAVLAPEGMVTLNANENGQLACDEGLLPPHAHPDVHKAVAGYAGTFFRLVMAYYFFGPHESREPVTVTPTERLNKGKPRNGQSLFAVTHLQPSSKLGRPQSTIAASWSLTERQRVDGHFKLQAYGPNRSERRMIWIEAYERGPADALPRPKGVAV
jgi:hypothetical protein